MGWQPPRKRTAIETWPEQREFTREVRRYSHTTRDWFYRSISKVE